MCFAGDRVDCRAFGSSESGGRLEDFQAHPCAARVPAKTRSHLEWGSVQPDGPTFEAPKATRAVVVSTERPMVVGRPTHGMSSSFEGTTNMGGLMIGTVVLGASSFVLFRAWRRVRRRQRKGLAWSDNSPKPPSSHNLKG
jgi:hypothetical protein